MSRLVGIPDVAAASSAPLTATLIWTHEYRRGDRFAAGRVDLTYDRTAGEWREGGAVFDLLAARFGQSDPAPPNIRVLFTLAGTQGTSLTFVPIESAAGTVDLTKPLNVAQWVVGAEYASLQVQQQNAIAALNEFSAAGGAVAQDIAENLGLLGGVLAELADTKLNIEQNLAALGGLSVIGRGPGYIELAAIAPATITRSTETVTVGGVDYSIGVLTLSTGGTP